LTKNFVLERRIWVPTQEILTELRGLSSVDFDFITFSGLGEPTLALNLGEVIKGVKELFPGTPVAVLTNSSLMSGAHRGRADVWRDLALADRVMAKLDAPNEALYQLINRPGPGLAFKDIFKGILEFQREYPAKLVLQMMFVPQNQDYAKEMAALAREVNPLEVELNTPLRPSPVRPLMPEEMEEIKGYFEGLPVKMVYEVERPCIQPLDRQATVLRRPE